jgi:hypothetical protein
LLDLRRGRVIVRSQYVQRVTVRSGFSAFPLTDDETIALRVTEMRR